MRKTIRPLLTNASLIQSDPVRLPPYASLGEALRAMTQAKARHALVEDEDGKMVGLVSDRDLRLALPSRLGLQPPERLMMLDDLTVMEVCVRRPYTAHPGGSATRAAELMVEQGIGCLPLVDTHDRAIGIITLADIARVFAALASELVVTPAVASSALSAPMAD